MTHLPTINALGTQFWIEIWDDVPQTTLTTIHTRIEGLLLDFENTYSRFKSDSLLSQLNQTGSLANPSLAFRDLLLCGLGLYDKTRGLCNMMVGETLEASGYDQNYSFTPKSCTADIPNPHDILTITPTTITLTRGRIDIGGYGKGLVIDQIATLLRDEYSLSYFLINGGGDMYGTSNHGKPITLYLEHPTIPDTYLGTVDLVNQGFAASSIHKRAWRYNGKSYHHIIDTHTGPNQVAEKSDASFVVAATALDADVFATIALIAPPVLLEKFAIQYELGVATFSLPSTLSFNIAFDLQTIPKPV